MRYEEYEAGYGVSEISDYHNLATVRNDPTIQSCGIATEHGFERTVWAKQNLEPVEPKYSIVWKRPTDGGISVTIPSPQWLAEAMFGFAHPVEAVLRDRRIEREHHQKNPGVPFRWKDYGGAISPYAKPVGPMTEEEAMEHLLQITVPEEVWDGSSRKNTRQFVICPRELVPTDRSHRNSWELTQ